MKFKDFLRADKVITDPGQWSTGKPAKKLLPLSKGKFSLGPEWTWRKMVVKAADRTFHVVIAYHKGKENYHAYLGLVAGTDTLVLASIEYHGTHPGWHLHVNCEGSGGSGNLGRLHYPEQRRLPEAGRLHRRQHIELDENWAMKPVFDFFKLGVKVHDEPNGQQELL